MADIRLKDLTGEGVAEFLIDALLSHVQRITFPLDPSYRITIDRVGYKDNVTGELKHDPLTSCTLGATVADLLAWTQRGELGDWEEPDGPLDAIQSVVSAYYGSAGTADASADLGTPEGETPTSPIGVLITAAMGRVSLVQGDAIRPAQLAALGSVGPSQIRNEYEPAGPLKKMGRGAIDRESALTWLSGRGVRITAPTK